MAPVLLANLDIFGECSDRAATGPEQSRTEPET
jgi:hypothetical protein